MKELSIEEKAKAYDEALERAKRMFSEKELNYLFPELKENEGERIRKELIEFIKSRGGFKQEYIAWLDKQGEQKSTDTDNKFIRMRETKPKDISEFLDRLTTVEQEFLWEHIAKIRELDKDEQKPTDKVEPKFHEGDWAVSNLDRKARQISEVHFDEYNSYYVVDGKSVNLEEYDRLHHLWTIQDAKDGDVLVARGKYYKEYIFIYSKMTDDNVMSTHCGYDVTHDEFDKTLSRFGRVEDFYYVCPTKEQRYLLFQKMKEAGYEWDAEKKELKKIEQKPLQYNILDYKTWQYIVSDVLTKHNGIGQYLDDGFCKKIAKYMQEEWSKRLSTEQKPAWSEEDDYNLQCMIAKVTSDIQKGNVGRNQELIDWLKSLRPQNR